MGVIATGSIFKTLTFDGRSSSEFNVYITGEGVFNAPERAVEMISIPGRNGAFALDNGRFENIEVTYNCGIAGDNDTDFAEAVSAFRNWLCSRNGYVRLTDDYNADEYRMAIYKSGLEVTSEQLTSGEFPIVFECKPQRFLTSGDDLLSLNQYRELAGTDTTPYLFRASPQFSTSYDTEMDELVGGTLAVNQLVQTTDTEVTVTSGHKYLSKINGVQTVAQSDGTAIAINDGTKDNIFDLTQMFGTTIADYVYNLEQSTAGSGVAWLKQYYPSIFNSYQPYNAGTLESVEASAHVMTGFNQFDANGAEIVAGNWVGNLPNKNAHTNGYIGVMPNAEYYFREDSAVSGLYIRAYDIEKNDLGEFVAKYGNNAKCFSFTTPQDAYYIRVMWYNTDGITTDSVKNDNICINISSDRNGEYEPYTQTSYPLDSTLTLRGIPKLDNGVPYYDGDEYESDGSVNRRYTELDFADFIFGNVTVGTSGSGVKYADIILAGIKVNERAISNKYTWILTSDTGVDKSFKTHSSAFTIYDNRFTDVDTAKNILISEAVSIVYMPLTPTTETADPFTNPQVCYKGGTEEYVADNVVPVGHNTKYGMNPAVVYNPTLFESRPMLEVTGSGAVNLGSDTIQINNDPIGDVVIFEQQTKNTASAWPVYIETQYANAGDPIIVTECQYTVNWTLSHGIISDITYTTTGDGHAGVYDVGAGMKPVVWLEDVEFAFGTASTITTTATFTIVTTYYGTLTADITLSLAYDGASQLILSHTATRPTQFSSASPRKTIGDVILRSSQIALGNPIYIDLNIGEAYKIENNVPVSVNNGVVIPAELPTLAPGANMITCDNTITQLDIVPRWWKI